VCSLALVKPRPPHARFRSFSSNLNRSVTVALSPPGGCRLFPAKLRTARQRLASARTGWLNYPWCELPGLTSKCCLSLSTPEIRRNLALDVAVPYALPVQCFRRANFCFPFSPQPNLPAFSSRVSLPTLYPAFITEVCLFSLRESSIARPPDWGI
jgi:hypothetical protein